MLIGRFSNASLLVSLSLHKKYGRAPLRSTARHVLRGLAVVGPPCIHQHNARETACRAHHDAFGNDRGAPWRNPTDGGGY